MVSYADLLDARPERFQRAAESWRDLALRLERHADDLDRRVLAPLRGDGWTGAANAAAVGHVTVVHGDYVTSHEQLRRNAAVLEELGDEVAAAQRGLLDAVRQAAADGIGIGGDGTVASPSIQARVDESLDRATRADERATLRFTAPCRGVEQRGDVVAESGRTVPEDLGDDPYERAKAWAALSAEERDRLKREFPQEIGSLDGIPARDRDDCNRLLFDGHLRRAHDRLAELDASKPQPFFFEHPDSYRARMERWMTDRAQAEDRVAGLETIKDRIGHQPPAYLVGLDPSGDGKAIIAINDPDRARNVAVYVPGTGSGLVPGIAEDIKRADLMADGDTAAYVWIGYDAPDTAEPTLTQPLPDAMWDHYAKDGQQDLRTFLHGVQATHDGDPHLTGIGHSYGSLVMGMALTDPSDVPVDDLVLVGSPGVGLRDVSGLSVPAEHVWVGLSRNDEIHKANDANTDGVHGWFGRDPADAEFGATVFDAGDGRHNDYWNNGTSLANILGVVRGGSGDG
ncbi:MAG: hypothetical protein HOV94_25395 [Saccharothrix sp.]|nr:hypothetical protein [Saccharothrix sp.]